MVNRLGLLSVPNLRSIQSHQIFTTTECLVNMCNQKTENTCTITHKAFFLLFVNETKKRNVTFAHVSSRLPHFRQWCSSSTYSVSCRLVVCFIHWRRGHQAENASIFVASSSIGFSFRAILLRFASARQNRKTVEDLRHAKT